MSVSIPLVRQNKQRLDRGSTRAHFIKAAVARLFSAHWLRCILLGAVALLVRSPALQGQRIWDDQYLAHNNPFIKSPVLFFEAFRHYLFMDSFSAHYRPIQNITYMVDYFFWNTNEFGYHLTNVTLHAISSVLLYFLVRQLLGSLVFRGARLKLRDRIIARKQWISDLAFLCALVWSVHPVHSAAIDYISGRADSLAFASAAGAWLVFFQARRADSSKPKRIFLFTCAAALALVGLLSREIAIVWMVIFLVHLFAVEKKISNRLRVQAAICCLAVVAIYTGFHSLPGPRSALPEPSNLSVPVRVTLMARALGDYGRLMLFPSRLHMERTVFYPQNSASNAAWRETVGTEYLSIFGALVLALLLAASMKKGNGQPIRIFGAAWFLAAYLPISNIVELNATVAEHWLYLPSVGFILVVIGFMMELPVSWRRVATATAMIAVCALGARSFVRSSDWTDEETFYNRTFEAGSRSARVAVNLAQIYAARKEYAKAEKMFRWVLEQNPEYPIAQNALASVLYQQGKLDEAEKLYAQIEKKSVETRKEYPRTWIGAYNLALVFHKRQHDQAAVELLEKARKDYSDVWEIVSLEAEILRESKGPDTALQLVEDFAHKNWWHHAAVLALGRLYAQKDNALDAETALRRASWLDIHDTEALRLIVQMQVRQNRLDEAVQTQRRAIARQPDEPSQYMLLSDILEKMGRNDEAYNALTRASRLRALVQNGPAQSL